MAKYIAFTWSNTLHVGEITYETNTRKEIQIFYPYNGMFSIYGNTPVVEVNWVKQVSRRDALNSRGIGEMVKDWDIARMSNELEKDENLFIQNIYNGAFANIAFAYIHPAEDMKKTRNFAKIQKAFINAYT